MVIMAFWAIKLAATIFNQKNVFVLESFIMNVKKGREMKRLQKIPTMTGPICCEILEMTMELSK
ncbi:hypothetical protein [Bacillus smithii]|uniref:hypothetical protein n=1 Tax=Bacillus smithii TaxID=1479 RepID=UPI002E21684C|nr:hypothetical protein [Bacillus smithii]